ncbi:cation:proton antiporter [Kitasatospora sp. NPDC048545]|uniref:cation:proton antiporter n=1 Tax=Kitasatospora sp. NPDC048545 TaxID=3157208 RepID=UPI0033F8F0C1
MSTSAVIGTGVHVVLLVAAILLLARLAHALARRAGQPTVIAEIAFGLIAGPLLLRLGGEGTLHAVVPPDVTDWMGKLARAGLACFLVGVGHEMRRSAISVRGRSVVWTTIGAMAVPLLCGGLLALWVLHGDVPGLRGHAPTPALVLLLAVSLTVTAVPVLARILSDSGLVRTRIGRTALTAAVVIDGPAWILLAVAVGLSDGAQDLGRPALVIAVTAVAFVALRAALRRTSRRVGALPRRVPVLVLVAGTVAATNALRTWGLPDTDILGALLIGLALPADGPDGAWTRTVNTASSAGLRLVPVFFVSTGLLVFTRDFHGPAWSAVALSLLLAVLGKVGGGYAGARLGGESHWDGLRLGVLLNTRGLTELVILQAGFSAGILTADLFLALVLMTLVTTAMTGPVYALVEARAARRPQPAAPRKELARP